MKTLAVILGLIVSVAAFASDDSGDKRNDLSDSLTKAECKPVTKSGKPSGYDCSTGKKAEEPSSGLGIKDDDELVPTKAKKPLSEKAKRAKEEIESKAFIPPIMPEGQQE